MDDSTSLSQVDLEVALAQAGAAFPSVTSWDSADAEDEDHCGLTVWGRLVFQETNFFVTFDHYRGAWRGSLTVGQHGYFWTSADFGDAWLVTGPRRATVDEAARALKSEVGEFFRLLLG